MARGLSGKEEAFCLAFVELGIAVDAYVHAYAPTSGTKKSHQELASRIKAKPLVAARIAELRADAAKEHAVTVADIAKQLDEDRTFARSNGVPAAAVSATVAKGKLYGFFVEKKDINVTLMTPEEARAILAAKLLKPKGKPGGKP